MPEPLQGFDYDPRNGHFHFPREYGSRLSWPLQQTSNDSPATAAMMPKRSTSPLPLSMDSNTYQQTAPYPPSSIMADWPVTSQAPPVSYPLDTTSFSQQPFDTFGTSFHASPTEYLTQQATLEASLEANMNPNMNPALPMDQTYMASTLSMQNNMSEMSPSMHNLAQLPLQWPSELEMNHYDLQNMQDLMAQQQPLGTMGSPSDTFSETYEVRSLSSSDQGYQMIERVDPHAGAVFNPQRTLHHPRTYSDSSSDNGQHSLGSYEIVDFSHGASSPSNESTGELNFPSDPETVPYWETERQSPPVAMSHTVIKPISTDQPLPTSPQRSPTSPPGRNRLRKNTTSKTTTTPNKIGKKQNVQGAKPETTEKRVGRRKGPLRPDQRKQASEIRKLGACIRCRFLKKTVRFFSNSFLSLNPF